MLITTINTAMMANFKNMLSCMKTEIGYYASQN